MILIVIAMSIMNSWPCAGGCDGLGDGDDYGEGSFGARAIKMAMMLQRCACG